MDLKIKDHVIFESDDITWGTIYAIAIPDAQWDPDADDADEKKHYEKMQELEAEACLRATRAWSLVAGIDTYDLPKEFSDYGLRQMLRRAIFELYSKIGDIEEQTVVDIFGETLWEMAGMSDIEDLHKEVDGDGTN